MKNNKNTGSADIDNKDDASDIDSLEENIKNKKYLLKERYLQQFLSENAEYDKIFLFLDYDGTLAPFNPRPEEAYALENSVQILKKLADSEKFKLSFVSGRSLNGLRQMLDIKNANYTGSHGLELKLSFEEEIIYPFQQGSIDQESVEIYKAVKEEFKNKEDLRLEDKGFGLALHCGKSVSEQKTAEELKERFKDTDYHILAGRKIVEIRPKGWGKGKAVNYISERMAEHYAVSDYLRIYIGDDSTDEDAFKVIENGFSIYVKNQGDLSTEADYYIDDPKDTAKLLNKLAGEI